MPATDGRHFGHRKGGQGLSYNAPSMADVGEA